MADGLNSVYLLGNLGNAPTLKYTTEGMAILTCSLATNESYLDKNKERRERTEWHNVVIWGKRGEALAKMLKIGSRVFIEGSLHTSSWEHEGQSITAPKSLLRMSSFARTQRGKNDET